MRKIIATALVVTILSLMVLFALTQENFTKQTRNEQPEESQIKGTQTEHNINVKQAYDKLKNEDIRLLDVRTKSEFEIERIEQSVNLNSYEDLNIENVYIVYCQTGSRSSRALQEMKQLGFKEVYNMQGGIEGWRSSGFPTQ